MRRPGRVAEARGIVFSREIEQFFERAWRDVHACVWIADLREALRYRDYGKVGRLAIGNLMPTSGKGW